MYLFDRGKTLQTFNEFVEHAFSPCLVLFSFWKDNRTDNYSHFRICLLGIFHFPPTLFCPRKFCFFVFFQMKATDLADCLITMLTLGNIKLPGDLSLKWNVVYKSNVLYFSRSKYWQTNICKFSNIFWIEFNLPYASFRRLTFHMSHVSLLYFPNLPHSGDN